MDILTSYLSAHYCSLWPFCEVQFKGGVIIFLSFILSFTFALYVLPRILLISKKKHLYDIPDGRKSHTNVIPRLGGLIFVPSIFFSLSITIAICLLMGCPLNMQSAEQTVIEFLFLMGGITFLYLVGAKDDLVGVCYRKKFLAQILIGSLFPLSGLYLNNLYGLLGIYTLPVWIAVPLTVFLVVYITNAINLIDGIDGLASGGSVIAFLVFGALFFDREAYIYSILSITAVGGLLPFMYYNIVGGSTGRLKMFMGDTGSLTLGYLLAFLSIRYAMYIPENSSFNEISLLYPISLLFIPVFDVFRVLLVRAFQHKHLFLADCSHIHHLCLNTGLSHLQSSSFLLSFDVLLIVLNIYLVKWLNINLILVIDILLFLTVVVVLKKVIRR